jgi:uncharacterized protein involved in exopolysaccharide biosynthesis
MIMRDQESRSAVGLRDDEVSLLGILNVILLYRRLIAAVMVLGIAGGLLAAAIGGRQYVAVATFMPQTRSLTTNVSGLAAQFGLNVPAGDPGQTPQFYIDLLKSRQILRDAAETQYSVPRAVGTARMTLVDLYGRPQSNAPSRREDAIAVLANQVTAKVRPTGVVDLTVRSDDASLAQQIAAKLLALLNQFNLERRQSQAAAERRFAERRLAEVRRELQDAEFALQSFLQGNRQLSNSPALEFGRERLARDVAMRQQVYTTLMQSYEQAKLDEVRDTPVITVIEAPEVPIAPQPLGLLKHGLIGALLGLSFGMMLAFARHYFVSVSGDLSDEGAEFSTLRADTVSDLKHPWRFLLPRRASG